MKPLRLSEEDLRLLRAMRKGNAVAAHVVSIPERAVIAWRAKVILALHRGRTNHAVALRLRTSPASVGKWRARFVDQGVAGLLEARTARGGHGVSHDIRNAVASRSRRGESTRAIARAVDVSQSTVSRLLRGRGGR